MMRIIAERTMEVDEELCICFIDWQKAFDRVNWTKLMQILNIILCMVTNILKEQLFPLISREEMQYVLYSCNIHVPDYVVLEVRRPQYQC